MKKLCIWIDYDLLYQGGQNTACPSFFPLGGAADTTQPAWSNILNMNALC